MLKVVRGKSAVLISVKTTPTIDTWHRVGIQVRMNHISIWWSKETGQSDKDQASVMEGKPILSVFDSELVEGGWGLVCMGCKQPMLDSLKVEHDKCLKVMGFDKRILLNPVCSRFRED